MEAEAWWSASSAGWIGAIGGGLGALVGVYGALAGTLAPRGKARALALGLHTSFLVVGGLALAAGLAALLLGQPYHVWYPLLLGGGIATAVLGGLLPVVRMRYVEAERRRLAASELRRA
ncbi:MAG TPA: hypothetical protein VMS76_14345 [Planctomycetota bacterium]|nr:hypothetical protein [Planctomycetota bacterium]